MLRNNKKKKLQQQQQQLSDDLILEILSWLPVSYILRLKSVSKSWFSLITSCTRNPGFVESHLNHSKKIQHDPTVMFYHPIGILCPMQLTTENSGSAGLVDDDVPTRDGYWASICELPRALELEFNHVQPDKVYRIHSSCNGLIFISIGFPDRLFLLWNPCTHEIKQIPKPPVHAWKSYCCDYELVYDDISGDYKIMMYVFIYGYGRNRRFDMNVSVYTLETKIWRRIPDTYKLPPSRTYCNLCKPLFLNYTHHWVAYENDDDQLSLRILAFDIADENYREVPTPQICYRKGETELNMTRGYLCIHDLDYGNKHLNVWVMKEYGVQSSWTKLFSVAHPELVHMSSGLELLWSFENSDDILLHNNKGYTFLFDPQKDNAKLILRPPPPPKLWGVWKGTHDYIKTLAFIGSFVSLNSDTYLRMIKCRGRQEEEKKKEINKKKKGRKIEYLQL